MAASLARTAGCRKSFANTNDPTRNVSVTAAVNRFNEEYDTGDIEFVMAAGNSGIEAATNDVVHLERGLIDVAIRYAAPDAAPPGAISLFGEEVFPVCAPALVRDPTRRLENPRDLERHVLLHLDYPAGRGSWLDWGTWLTALGVADLRPAAALHFTQYDQMIQAAIAGQGVALGRSPLVGQLLRSGTLVAPFAHAKTAPRAYFLIESAHAAGKPQVKAFAAWLRQEAADDALAGAAA